MLFILTNHPYFSDIQKGIQKTTPKYTIDNLPVVGTFIFNLKQSSFHETRIATCPQRKIKEKELRRQWPTAFVEKIKNVSSFTVNTTEDCLRLNINVPTTGKLSMVYFGVVFCIPF
jgi:hypothetical protein